MQSITNEQLQAIFPSSKSDEFFEAIYGDIDEGAYDIYLCLGEVTNNSLELNYELRRRKDKCLACSLTYGLPQVFDRHPIINLKNTINEVAKLADIDTNNLKHSIGKTIEKNSNLHIIPIKITW